MSSRSAHKPRPAVAPPLAHAIEWAILDDLYRNVRPTVIASVAAVVATVTLTWNIADRSLLVGWAALVLVLTVLRIGLRIRYFAKSETNPDLPFWSRALAVGSAAAGFLWGLTVVFFQALEPDWVKVATTIAFAAFSAIAIAAYAGRRDAFYSFLLPSAVPHGLALSYINREFDPDVIGVIVACLALAALMARNLRRQAVTAKALQIENRGLIERLTRARDEAEMALQAKTRFLANMSHELRTPLNAIIGFAEMMLRNVLGPIPRYEGYVRGIHDSGTHLLKVIDEVLDVSKLEAGRVDIAEDTIELGQLVEGAVTLLSDHAAADRIRIESRIESGLSRVRGDAVKLRQVLLNLLSNAVKFTPPGGRVTVSAGRVAGGGLAIEVEDTGIGIAPGDLPRVTIPFARLEQREHMRRVRAQRRDHGQTSNGLGLPLVKLLTELHGGRLELESALGRGTTARIILPPERLLRIEPAAA